MSCTGCGVLFEVKKYTLNIPTKHGRFCSRICRARFLAPHVSSMQRTSIEIACFYCGKDFSIQPYRLRDGSQNHFCSLSCSTKFYLAIRWADGPKMTAVTCAQCGEEIALKEWDKRLRDKRGQEQHFCNRQCFAQWKSEHWRLEQNPSWRGGWTPHGKGWAIICNQVRKEQKFRCADCKVTEETLRRALDVHHIIAARFFKTDQEASARANLVALCHSCHTSREHTELPLFAKAVTPKYRKRKQKTSNLF